MTRRQAKSESADGYGSRTVEVPSNGDGGGDDPRAGLPCGGLPRERLLGSGPRALSDAELMAVILRTGRPGRNAVELADELLADLGGLVGLLDAGPRVLTRRGVGPAKTAALVAVVELARRLARTEIRTRDPLSHPVAVARYLRLRYSRAAQEVMGALFLDARNGVVAEREIFRGTINRAAVEPRPILKQALVEDAAGLILFHTHPSGDPTPSAEDVSFTRRMAEAAEIVGVRLVDHLVVGHGGRWTSLSRLGECP